MAKTKCLNSDIWFIHNSHLKNYKICGIVVLLAGSNFKDCSETKKRLENELQVCRHFQALFVKNLRFDLK
jgi:hypothetical protein